MQGQGTPPVAEAVMRRGGNSPVAGEPTTAGADPAADQPIEGLHVYLDDLDYFPRVPTVVFTRPLVAGSSGS
jgi:hypothetical protein